MIPFWKSLVKTKVDNFFLVFCFFKYTVKGDQKTRLLHPFQLRMGVVTGYSNFF